MPKGEIAAVVLAAGASRRFGEDNKLLAEIGGQTLIACVLKVLADAGVAQVIVVTGWDGEGVSRAVRGHDVRLVHNAGWDAGMGSSIGVGIAALDAAASGAIIIPSDMPRLTSGFIAALMETFEGAGGERVVYPTTLAGEQRNPVLWPRRFFGALQGLNPAEGAKSLLLQLPASDRIALAIEDAGVFLDVDTQAELDKARGGQTGG
ncbi:MAG: NTP transferase domain-containing protein [Hyphomicrobium sp.]